MTNRRVTWSRRAVAITATVALAGIHQWAGGAQFGPSADPAPVAAGNVPTPPGGHTPEDEFADRILRDDEFYRARAFPAESVPAGALSDARAQADLLPVISAIRELPTSDGVIATDQVEPSQFDDSDALLADVDWTQVGSRGVDAYVDEPGPFPQLRDFNGTPPLSGRIVAIANHPDTAGTAYIGAASGGVFKTTDGGSSWTPVFDDQVTLSVGALAIDPDNGEVVYVGTGESSGGAYYGQGIFKSTNGGTTWTKIGDTVFDYCHISDIVVIPGTSIVLAAVSASLSGPTNSCTNPADSSNTSTGIWRSTDDGSTWTEVYTTGAATDLEIDLDSAATDPATTTRIIAGVYDQAIVTSTNSGATWTMSATMDALTDRGRVETTWAGGSVFYAAVQRQSDSSLLGLYKSTDGGNVFAAVDASPPSDICTYSEYPDISVCGYAFDLQVHPVNSDELFLAGVRLGRSTDGGKNFTQVGNVGYSLPSTQQIHVDVQVLSFDASNRLWVGTDGGIQRTANGTSFTNLNADLNLLQFQHGISTTPEGTLFGGTQDLGTLRYTGGPGWTMITGGDGGPTAVDPRDSDIVYSTYTYGQTYVSPNGGEFSNQLNQADCQGGGSCLFYSPLEMDPARPDTIYTGTQQVFRTTTGWNFGSEPVPISQPLDGVVSAISPAATDADRAYAGTTVGSVWVTDDGGATLWQNRSSGLPGRYVTDLLVDPNNADVAWVTVSGFDSNTPSPGHVFTTTNGGTSWTNVSGDLPDTPVNAIDADFRTAAPNLFVGTDVGVFASDDGGTTWATYGTGLPNAVTLDVVLNSAQNTLTAGTASRGMWQAPAGCPVPVNDAFENALPLVGTADSDSGHNMCASTQFAEPRHETAGESAHSMWWTWTAPYHATVEVDTLGSAVDTVLAVYSGKEIGALTQVAQNDDIVPGTFQSGLTFNAVAGVEYHIAVAGYLRSSTGAVAVNLSSSPIDAIVALAPGRIYETRSIPGAETVDRDQEATGRTTAGEVVEVMVAGRADVPLDADAAVLNITAIRPDAGGFITSFPCGSTRPLTASLNFAQGQVIANGAIIKIGAGGKVCVYTSQAMDLVVDVTGYTPSGSPVGALAPGRIYETRTIPGAETVDRDQEGVGRTGFAEVVEVQVGGRAGVPIDADAAVLNITAIRPDGGGFITSFPCGSTQPLTASLNFAQGQIIANGAIIKIGDGGKVCVFTSHAMDLVVDVTGYVPTSDAFGALAPGRLYETRSTPGAETVDRDQEATGRTTAGEVVEVMVAGRADVPLDADAAVLNITAIRPDAGGFITSFPCGSTQPLTASLNFAQGQVIANGAIIKIGAGGKVCVFTSQAMDLVVDVTGFVTLF